MSSRKITLVLTEIVIVIFILATASAYCLNVFAGASEKTRRSEHLRLSAIAAQNAAECWKASGGNIEKTMENLESVLSDYTLDSYSSDSVIYSDENFYVIIEAQERENYICPAKISIYVKISGEDFSPADPDPGSAFFVLNVHAVYGGES